MSDVVVAGVEELSERVMALVAEETGRERVAITPATDIERDLGCSIEEIERVLARLQREFRIDMTGLDLDRHFDRTGSYIWPLLVASVVSLPLSVIAMLALGPVFALLGIAGTPLAAGGGLLVLVYLACVVLIGLVTTALPRLRARRAEAVPVTVQTLIEAALMRKWPMTTTGSSAENRGGRHG